MRTENLVGVWVEHPLGGGRGWAFATGYCVAPNRVLTARHVLKPGWTQIKVAGLSIKQTSTPARIAWPDIADGEGHIDGAYLDAVLLDWAFPAGLSVVIPGFVDQPPDGLVDWFCNCFPDALAEDRNPVDGLPSYLGVDGQLNPPREIDDVVPLNCSTKGLPASEWMGASGSPVFERAGFRIVGILKAVKSGLAVVENGKAEYPIERLAAVPMWRILASPGFWSACGFPVDQGFQTANEEWLRTAPDRLHAILSGITDVSVVRQFELAFRMPSGGFAAQLKSVCARLAQDPGELSALVELRRRFKRLDKESLECLLSAELLLLPMLFTAEQRREIWAQFKRKDVVLIAGAAATQAGAQIRIAAIDGRPARFPGGIDKNKALGEWLGEGALDFGELSPGDMAPKAIALRIVLELARFSVGPELIPITEQARNEILSGKPSQQTLGDALTQFEATASALRAVLRTNRRWLGTPYCMIEPKHAKIPRETICAAIEEIRKLIPELLFLEVTNAREAASVRNDELPHLTILKTHADHSS